MLKIGYNIQINNLNVFHENKKYKILTNINLDINSGKIVAIVGPNGAGKSTLLKAITGEIKNMEGNINVGGQNINKPISNILAGVGIVHQDEKADLVMELNVMQNIAIRQSFNTNRGKKIIPITNIWKEETAEKIATIAGIANAQIDLHTEIINLSGGVRKMLCVALSTDLEHSDDCRLLILDEHTANLDPKNSDKVMEYTFEQAKKINATVLMVTHSLKYAIKYAEEIIIIREGEIIDRINKKNKLSEEELFTYIFPNDG